MNLLNRFETLFAWVTGVIAMAFLLFLMVGTSSDVASRFFLGNSIPGVFEMAELAMVVCVMFGLGWAQQGRKHIRVTLLVDRLPPRARAGLEAFAWIATAILLMLIAAPATQEAYHSTLDREFRWGVVRMPVWWVKIIVALGLWLASLQMLKCAVEALAGGGRMNTGRPTEQQDVPHA
ncbi:TRAP transporter small permease [Aquisalimonas asiatica]|uniref:TRAP transporter small permease protein n=1 Tax=Aquisalimonas asiatica TaxID=406100 RepID=A0A1H8S6N5_9GAMM|nr:TRAP transporter small permease [Aquisalimonas asiatica]SEO74295.1 TRAP-type C4-dicarboxylate transport system, small permease component [Aquisalimonas asiatica]